MPTTIGNLITLDGQFTDWPAADSLMTPANTVAGYQLYGALLNDTVLGKNYVIGIDATVATDPVIAAYSFIYLNTDQNRTTGYTPFRQRGCRVLRAVRRRCEQCASALSLLGHIHRRRHPAQRRDAAQFRSLRRWRKS